MNGRPIELHNIISDLDPVWENFMGYAKRYADAHQVSIGRHTHWDFSGASNLDELQRKLRETIMVRRLKEDVLTELPAKVRQVIEMIPESDAAQALVRDEAEFWTTSRAKLEALRAEVETAKEDPDAYRAAAARLREYDEISFTEISRMRHETAVAKVPQVVDHLAEAMGDDEAYKIIVAAHHRDVIDQIRSAGVERGWRPVILTGAENTDERQAAVDAFQNNPAVRLFIGSITAAGVGITLTASSHVVFAELDWVPGNISQMEDRAHRIGQRDSVLVQHLVLSGSIDAKMIETIISKQDLIDSSLDRDHPARVEAQAPVYAPKPAAPVTAEVPVEDAPKTKRQLLDDVAKTLTAAQMDAIHTALKMLAGMDQDHAMELNGKGFSKIDGTLGHDLASAARLSPRQAALGQKLARKYRRQLPAELLAVINGQAVAAIDTEA